MQQVEGDRYGLVLRLDEDGGVVDGRHDPDGRVFGATSATPLDGALYLGSLFGERVVGRDPGCGPGQRGSSFTPLSQSYRRSPA